MKTGHPIDADVQQILDRASDLMLEALVLLDRAQNAQVAALLDHAIALLPGYPSVVAESRLDKIYSDKSSSIRR